MSNLTFGERRIVKGLDPAANAFAGTIYCAVTRVNNYDAVRFIYYKAVGLTGTATLTIEACDDLAGTNPVAIPFAYQAYTGANDVPGAVTQALAAGFTTIAGSSQLYVLECEMQRMAGKQCLRLKSVEGVASPVLGGVLIEMVKPAYGVSIPTTVLV
jgi:hypothetical protein